MTTEVETIAVRLPVSLKAAIEEFLAPDGTALGQFLVLAAAEKLAAVKTPGTFFAQRKGQGDADAAIRFLTRPDSEPPRAEDEYPEK